MIDEHRSTSSNSSSPEPADPHTPKTVRHPLVTAIKGFQKRWGKRLADETNTNVSRPLSGYGDQYTQHIIVRHRDLDVKGVSAQGPHSLDLTQVFVELSIIPQPLQTDDPNRFRLGEPLLPGRRAFWEYLKRQGDRSQPLLITGTPGSGKTTLLKHVALMLADRTEHQSGIIPKKLPILLFLRDHVDKIMESGEFTLAQAVQDSLTKFGGPLPPQGWFEEALANGQCLVMLDGLDEAADSEARKKVATWVENQRAAHDKNPFVVTSRPFGYQSNPLGGINVLEICPFSRKQQSEFVHNWYLANEIMRSGKDDDGVRRDARVGAADLLKRIQSAAALSELAVNPLLLTMIATVHCYRSALPHRRVGLYNEFCDIYLGTFQQAKGTSQDFMPTQKQRILQSIAYQMMLCNTWEITRTDAEKIIQQPSQMEAVRTFSEDFLKRIEQSSGLLLERANGVYSFAHPSFQEYFAAVHVHEQKLEGDLMSRLQDGRWHETIRFSCAQTSDATPMIAACLDRRNEDFTILALAIECLEEAKQVQTDLRARLETIVNEQMEADEPGRRRLAAETFLTRRLRRMVRVDDNKYIDNTLMTHAEYQLFLDEQRAKGKYHQPDHWSGAQFVPGQGRNPVVGIRPSDAIAFCEWLSQRESGPWRYRPPMPNEPGMGDLLDDARKKASTNAGFWVISEAETECIFDGSRAPSPPPSGKLALAYDLARALDQDLAHARNLDQDLVLAFALTLAFNFDLELARELVRERDHGDDPDRELDLALERARERDHGDDPDPDRELERAREIIHALASYRVYTIQLSRDVSREASRFGEVDLPNSLVVALTHALAHFRARGRALDCIRSLEAGFYRAFNLDLARDCINALNDYLRADLDFSDTLYFETNSVRQLTRELERARVRLARTRELNRARELSQELARARDHERARELSQELNRELERDRKLNHELNYARELIRELDHAFNRDPANNSARSHNFLRNRSKMIGFLPFLLYATCDFSGGDSEEGERVMYWQLGVYGVFVYIALVDLERRIKDPGIAAEGLRIVRERVAVDTSEDASPSA